ncbi:hypothetical protein Poly51_60030 [Rubripirellula tenax]|uniref:Uncharacterized protein n=1 Tax=Rubripirellula tenax TaxID=2528015 RepID=A0A5C6E6K6_9BACT|nr:hypothetical protein Poly51_60030 [Rubripirellula tenax]
MSNRNATDNGKPQAGPAWTTRNVGLKVCVNNFIGSTKILVGNLQSKCAMSRRVSSRQGASLRGQLMVRGSFGCVRSYRRLISLQDRAIG